MLLLAYINFMKYWPLILLFTAITATAGVYRSVDENGNVVFTDQPAENAEKIVLPQASVYTPVDVPEEITSNEFDDQSEQLDGEDMPPAPSYALQIVSPQDDQAIRVNDGNLTVNIQIQPALNQQRGDLIQLQMDGLPYGDPRPSLSFGLPNVDRGTHTLSAVVMNINGEVLANSPEIKFHLQRNSILLNPRTSPAPTPNPAPAPGGSP
ncbi:DUF4124 domain-containing protein [Methylophaga sp. OBS3]|nr:DUF4124 domain-containing protein [Methylophaga sp. OBS3]